MSFNKYYQDELAFLREMGKEFAQAYPAIAPHLADHASDPDVERLMEGFAFLVGRIRQKLDDEFPEFTHVLMELLWPHYLRPIPSLSILEFTPLPGALRDTQRIPRGTSVASVPVEGTACRFQTCFDVEIHPFTVEDARFEISTGERPSLRIRFRMESGVPTSLFRSDKIRLYLSGDPGFTLYLWLCHYVQEVQLRTVRQDNIASDVSLLPSTIQAVGFSREEALLPYPRTSFEGYRLLQEYFTFPEKFLFVEISGLHRLTLMPAADTFELQFVFRRPPPVSLRVTRENLRLYCTPIINLFPMESDPLRVDHTRTEYPIRPAARNPSHYEIYSIEKAVGWIRGTAQERVYEPFYSFRHSFQPPGSGSAFYQTRYKSAVVGNGIDMYVSFVNAQQETVVPPTETVVFRLMSTNHTLAGKLKGGDIRTPTDSSPEFARFSNITRVTPTIRPPMDGDLYWRLISHFSLNSTSLTNLSAFRGILGLYNFPSLYDRSAGLANDRRLEGIQHLQSQVENRFFQGTPILGTVIQIALREDHFAGEGDMYLFASILNEFMALYATINSFTQIVVKGVQHGEVYPWNPKMGQQILM